MLGRLRTVSGIARSLAIYHWNRRRHRAMDKLYRRFLRPGDLAFDVGAHVGDRTACFRRLGARVVAVEPQPSLVPVLRLLFGGDLGVAIEPSAVGAAEGRLAMHLNRRNPTISTLSARFVEQAATADGWRDQQWGEQVAVPVTTLDTLIRRHGEPRFVKIDVEGFEAEVLAGLSRPIACLSFEFTLLQREVAAEALRRLTALADYRFNAALGESQTLVLAEPADAAGIARWLGDLPASANSGDIYAALDPALLAVRTVSPPGVRAA